MDSLERACNDAFIAMEAARASLDTAKASFEAAKAVAEAAEVALNSAERIYHSLMKRKEINEQEVVMIEDIDVDNEPRVRIRKVDEINGINNNLVINFKQALSDEESVLECSFGDEDGRESNHDQDRRHMANEDELFCKLFPCQLKKGFKDHSELFRHQQVHHFKNSKPFKCCECRQDFDTLVKLESHRRWEHKTTMKPVFNMFNDVVTFTYDIADDYEDLLKERLQDDDPVIKCFFCGQSFEDENKLQEHARRRFLNRSCVFKDDPVVVVKEISVKKKTKKKTKKKMASSETSKCSYCGKAFSSLLALKKHTEQSLKRRCCFIGEDDNIFQCKLAPCKNMFLNNPSALYAHQQLKTKKQHFGVKKPFKCFNCGKEFVSYVKLYSHEKSVHSNIIHAIYNMNNDTMEFTYYVRNDSLDPCKECGKKLANKEKFDLHMKAAHPAVFEDNNSKYKKKSNKNVKKWGKKK